MSKEYKIIRVHYQNHYSKELLFEAEMETRSFNFFLTCIHTSFSNLIKIALCSFIYMAIKRTKEY